MICASSARLTAALPAGTPAARQATHIGTQLVGGLEGLNENMLDGKVLEVPFALWASWFKMGNFITMVYMLLVSTHCWKCWK